MSGLSRFDFYPRDWHLDTRGLSQAAKGIYIDILSAMYARGGGLPNDEHDLCAVTDCRTVRSLRPLLGELIKTGKLRVENGLLVNGRALEELAKFDALRSNGSTGGKARVAAIRTEYGPNSSGTYAVTSANFEGNQQLNLKPPSPSPSNKKKEAVAYRFFGRVIRLTDSDFRRWESDFHGIADLNADLGGIDDWMHRHHPEGDPQRNDWWFPVRGMLNKRHQRAVAEAKAAQDANALRKPISNLLAGTPEAMAAYNV